MEKPLYKVGDIIIWKEDTSVSRYKVVKVRKESYDLHNLEEDKTYKDHHFKYTHGNVRRLSKLEIALK